MPTDWDAYIKHLIASGVGNTGQRNMSDSRDESVPSSLAESRFSSRQEFSLPSHTSATSSKAETLVLVEVLLCAMGGEQAAQVPTEQMRRIAQRFADLVTPAIAQQSNNSASGLGRQIAQENREQLSELLAPLSLAPGGDMRVAVASGSGLSISNTGEVRESATSDSVLEDDEWCF